jgi:hypothetical protein
MRPSVAHRCLQALLALLLLVNSVLAAAQTAHHVIEEQSVTTVKIHDDDCRDHYQVASIDSGTDEHGHCFHVHLPAHALVSQVGVIAIDATAGGIVVATPPMPVSLLPHPPFRPPMPDFSAPTRGNFS